MPCVVVPCRVVSCGVVPAVMARVGMASVVARVGVTLVMAPMGAGVTMTRVRCTVVEPARAGRDRRDRVARRDGVPVDQRSPVCHRDAVVMRRVPGDHVNPREHENGNDETRPTARDQHVDATLDPTEPRFLSCTRFPAHDPTVASVRARVIWTSVVRAGCRRAPMSNLDTLVVMLC